MALEWGSDLRPREISNKTAVDSVDIQMPCSSKEFYQWANLTESSKLSNIISENAVC